jgi:hypothetical protein
VTPIAARCRLLLAGLATAAMLATPASAVAAPAPAAAGCLDTPLSHPFAAWGDAADYFLAPGGAFDRGAAAWTLRAGAGTVDGNEPFRVVAPSDNRSLRLPGGSAAISPAFCIGAEHRTMRFFANASTSSSLGVDVLYADPAGHAREMAIGTLAGAGHWAPTDIVPMVVNKLAGAYGNAMSVRLRLTPRSSAAWAVDDVFVDPYRGR